MAIIYLQLFIRNDANYETTYADKKYDFGLYATR